MLLKLLFLTVFRSMDSKILRIRSAEASDLPKIQELIKDSFLAMIPIYGEPMRESLEKSIRDMCEGSGELTAGGFETTYKTNAANNFLVAENEHGVVGCVAKKRKNSAEVELVRMAVTPEIRGRQIGAKLVEEFIKSCDAEKVQRIVLVTANPDAARFYERNGFVSYSKTEFKRPTLEVPIKIFKMVKYLGERLIRRVVIVGGTHGNERIGIELVRQWSRDSHPIKRSTFASHVMIGNKEATRANRRYVARDLNRQFLGADVQNSPFKDQGDDQGTSSETLRSIEVDAKLGPKGCPSDEGVDFVIDLHSSSSNTGLMAMISAADHDCVAVRLAHHLQLAIPGLRITTTVGEKKDSPSLDSIAPTGLAFEVGPLTHGTINHALMSSTRDLILKSLDYIEARNLALLDSMGGDSSCSDGAHANIVHGEAIVPASFPVVDCFTMSRRVSYPPDPFNEALAVEAQCEGVAAAALEPVVDEGVTPAPWTVHPSIADWAPIKVGDPVFISTDGRDTVATLAPEGEGGDPNQEYYPAFVNEAAYQEARVGFVLFTKSQRPVY